MIFQGNWTRIAENPYIFVIFRWGGGGGGGGGGASGSADVRWRRIFWRPSIFYCCSHCIIMLFSVDERGHLGEKKSVADNIYMSGASHCVVSLSKTHLSLF